MHKPINISVISPDKSKQHKAYYPLSSVQQGIWLDQMLNPDVPYYNIGMMLRVDGYVNVASLEKAINLVVVKNDALRLVLCKKNGVVQQQVLPLIDISLAVIDFSNHVKGDEQAWRYMRQAFIQPFDLEGGLLWEWRVIQVSNSCYYLLHRYHHLITDGYGVQLIAYTVADAYSSVLNDDASLSNLGPSYLEFIAEDEAYLSSQRYERDKQFWCKRFAELPRPLVLQTRTVNSGEILPSDQVLWSIERPMFDRITDFAAKH